MKTKKSIFFIAILYLTVTQTIIVAKDKYDFFTAVKELSQYLASENFRRTKGKLNDLERTNLIFEKAKELTPSISEALLVSTFATIPSPRFPLITPFFKIRINIPIPVGPLKIFRKKLKALPNNFFLDSPRSKFGDVDKLAHFFANAFLVYNLKCYNISNFMGILIELFENNFKMNGFVDSRDLRVNHLGALFGKALSKKANAKPSDFLGLYNFLFFKTILF
jgi:hypothetical protein